MWTGQLDPSGSLLLSTPLARCPPAIGVRKADSCTGHWKQEQKLETLMNTTWVQVQHMFSASTGYFGR